jgi:hypothetical protein
MTKVIGKGDIYDLLFVQKEGNNEQCAEVK